MEAKQSISMEQLRAAIRAFCKGEQPVSNLQLYDALNLTDEKEKNSVRARLVEMAVAGELNRIAPGLYTYNLKYRVNTDVGLVRLWRFVRQQQPGWGITQASLLTRVHYSQISRYCSWLETEGYIKKFGKKKNIILYVATDKAASTPETPCMPTKNSTPFEKENAAAAKIARLMLCHDPHSIKIAREIVSACKTLLARFDTPTNLKTKEENEC